MTETPWRIVADEVATCTSLPIPLEFDRETRVARLRVPGLGEFQAEPANCVEHRVTPGSTTFSNRTSYAQFAAVEWTHA